MVDYAQARQLMVDTQLRTSNITDRRLLAVMGDLPRELFVSDERRELAYIDDIQPIGRPERQRYLASPAPFGRLVQLAEVDSTDSVLDVGAATGYSTSVLAGLARRVVGVESDPELAAKARENLAMLKIHNAEIVEASLDSGPNSAELFDIVLVEGAVEQVPPRLFGLLKEGGKLVALIRSGATATAKVYLRTGDEFAARTAFDASLPPLETVKREQEFVF